MQQEGLKYCQQDNCFVWLQDWARAQHLLDQQLQTDWVKLLDGIARDLHPSHERMFARLPLEYYWSVYQSEWATDITFHRAADLQRLFPIWLLHAITTFQSSDVLRFLGQKVTPRGEVPGRVAAEVTSSLKKRQPGARIKHWYGENSLKAYDKAYTAVGSNLRAEVTVQNPERFQVFRRPEGKPDADPKWRPLRKGVADLHRRAEICQKTNERYLQALASVDSTVALEDLIADIQRPVFDQQRRTRALRPFGEPDVTLLEAIARGDFLLNGFRNRDLRVLLHPQPSPDPAEQRKRSAAISRRLRLLRAHRLIRKLSTTNRYHVTRLGRRILPAIQAARKATLSQLNLKAA